MQSKYITEYDTKNKKNSKQNVRIYTSQVLKRQNNQTKKKNTG